jgi:DNA (cytosine-5)-methyltransferase 1
MFFEAIRIIKEMRNATASRPTGPLPRAVVWENVPGALSSNNGEDFQAVLEALGDIGAVDIQWSVLDAQHFGVPQRRRRIFLVAIFDPATADRCDGPLLPVCEGRPRDFAKGRKKGEGATGDAEASPDGSGIQTTVGCLTPGAHPGSYNGQDAYNDLLIPFVKAKRAMSNTDDDRWEATETAPTLNAFDNGGESRATVLMPIPIQGTIIGRSDTAGPQGSGIGEPDGAMYTLDRISMHGVAQPIIFENSFRDGVRINDDISHTLPAKMGLGGGNQPHVAQPYSFDTQFGSNANVFVDQSPTLKASQQSPSIATSMAVRRLTPLECERLMGWPDDHTRYTDTGKEQADTHRYKQCGNGVASPVARWIAQQLTKIL